MIKKISFISLFALFQASYYYAQTKVFAYIKDEYGKPIERASITLRELGKDVTADKIGYFQYVDLKPGHYHVRVSRPNYEEKILEFEVHQGEKRRDLGVVTLYSISGKEDLGVVLVDDENNHEESTTQRPTLGFLQSSLDVFSRIASYNLGTYWFRPRGLDGRTTETMMNGVSMLNPDNGSVNYSNWGGLNEVTRYPETAVNFSPSEYAFGGVNSVAYKNTKASEFRKGFQLSQSFTNRNHKYRTTLKYASGMNKNGWAFTFVGARRWAQEGVQEGTFYDAYGAYLGIEKKLNDVHTLTLNVIGSPYRRSTSSPNTQEVYYYRGIYYNSYWGWQNGYKRNERVKKGFQPIFQLSDYWKINEKTQLWTSLSYQFGKERSSRLDWYNLQNPSPTYYKNLPSYFASKGDVINAGLYKNIWESNDERYTQIDWDKLYQINSLSDPFAEKQMKDLYGVEGKRAKAYLVDEVNDDKVWNASTHLISYLGERTKFLFNVSYLNYFSEKYREVKDLLGADYALNKDFYSETNHSKTSGLFNDGETNVAKKAGDRIGYDYIFRRQELKLNPALKFGTDDFDVFVSALASYTDSSREGLFKHYLYQDSFGKSKNYTSWNFGLKGQVIYKIDGRNFIMYNGTYYSEPHYLNSFFINPRVNPEVVPNTRNRVVSANDLSYIIASPFFKLRTSVYLINTYNDLKIQRFFADGISLSGGDGQNSVNVASAFVSEITTDIHRRNMGVEVGAEVNLTPTVSLTGALSYGQHTYANKPNVYFASDAIGKFSDGKTYKNYGKAYIQDFRQGNGPQQAYDLGIKYNSPKYWWVALDWNYLGANYLDPSSILHSDYLVFNNNTGTPYASINKSEYRRLLKQKKLSDAYFFNVNVGKSWILGKYYVLVTASVNNILNRKDYITSGFEQTRNVNYEDFKRDFEQQYPTFAPKYWYNQGRSYFINLQFRF